MSRYLLSTYAGGADAEPPGTAPPSPDDEQQAMQAMRAMMQRVIDLEADMDAAGAFVFGGHLHGPDAATVVQAGTGDTVMTDGPFAEAKEHIAGFYIVEADDLDAALHWAERVSSCVGRPIEVRPFGGTGRAVDQFPS